MDFTSDITKVKELLDKAQNVLIVTHERPNPDSVGSSLALYLGLTSLTKKVAVVCPDAMTVGLSNFIAVNKIAQELGKKNFVISLDYVDGSIEKVSYNIEGNKFNLVIEPRPGFPPFSQDKAHFSHTGTTPDLIFTVDTIHLGGLKKLYEDEKELYSSSSIVNIDRHPNNAQYGQVNIIDPSVSSTAEIVARFLSGLGVRLTVDIATNLLNAVYAATNNFSLPNVAASAFELAAVCVKAGGRRFGVARVSEEMPVGEVAGRGPMPTGPRAVSIPKPPVSWPPISGVPATGSLGHIPSAPPSTTEPAEAAATSPPPAPGPSAPPSGGSPQATSSSLDSGRTGQALPASGQAPEDWLKPKIFKSSNPV